MKITYLLVADAANQGPEKKINVLGMSLRKFTPKGMPVVAPVVILVGGEASAADIGVQPIKISIEFPSKRRLVIVDDVLDIKPQVDPTPGLPNDVSAQVQFPFVTEDIGLHMVRVQLGKARAAYPMFVTTPPDEATG